MPFLRLSRVVYGSGTSHREERASRSVGGIVVSIAAFQAVDPGSIPGRRINFCVLVSQPFLKLHIVYYVQFWLSLTVVFFSFFTRSLMKDSSLIRVILVFCD